MTLLVNHLDQINLSAKTIAELEFPPSRPFTNALLHNKEITALIRDPELYERGLFSVQTFDRDEKDQSRDQSYVSKYGSNRTTSRSDRQHQESAVARVLGADMLSRIQQSSQYTHRRRGVDIEVLLQGAEKLCTAYNVPGTLDRVQALRSKHKVVSASVARFETRVSEQQSSLKSHNAGLSQDEQDQETIPGHINLLTSSRTDIDEFDLEAEERVIQELETKRRALEAKLATLEKDLGGLLQ